MSVSGGSFLPPETLRPERCQPFAVQVEIAQREAGAQPVVVLLDASVSHLVEAKDTFQDPEWMFYFGSDSGLGGVAPFGFFVDEGAWRMVASTIVPVAIRMPLLAR